MQLGKHWVAPDSLTKPDQPNKAAPGVFSLIEEGRIAQGRISHDGDDRLEIGNQFTKVAWTLQDDSVPYLHLEPRISQMRHR